MKKIWQLKYNLDSDFKYIIVGSASKNGRGKVKRGLRAFFYLISIINLSSRGLCEPDTDTKGAWASLNVSIGAAVDSEMFIHSWFPIEVVPSLANHITAVALHQFNGSKERLSSLLIWFCRIYNQRIVLHEIRVLLFITIVCTNTLRIMCLEIINLSVITIDLFIELSFITTNKNEVIWQVNGLFAYRYLCLSLDFMLWN